MDPLQPLYDVVQAIALTYSSEATETVEQEEDDDE